MRAVLAVSCPETTSTPVTVTCRGVKICEGLTVSFECIQTLCQHIQPTFRGAAFQGGANTACETGPANLLRTDILRGVCVMVVFVIRFLYFDTENTN